MLTVSVMIADAVQLGIFKAKESWVHMKLTRSFQWGIAMPVSTKKKISYKRKFLLIVEESGKRSDIPMQRVFLCKAINTG